MFRIKRIYEPAEPQDGYRVLVDGLWPRGIAKSEARFDRWLKEVAPSRELRSWFRHEPSKWDEFRERYAAELERRPDTVAELRRLESEHGAVTLLFAASDRDHNNARALREFLDSA